MSQIGRKLAMNNPTVTNKYLDFVETAFKQQNICHRVEKLFYQWTKKQKNRWEVTKRYEKLDKEIFDICRTAEDRCRKSVSGNYHWSPALAKAINNLTYWRSRKKFPDENNLITHLGKKADIQYQILTHDDIQSNINQSMAALKEVQKNSLKHRQQHLEDLADAYASENNLTKANAIKVLLSHESTKRMYSIMREKMKGRQKGQLQSVWVAYNDEGQYVKDTQRKVEITSPKDSSIPITPKQTAFDTGTTDPVCPWEMVSPTQMGWYGRFRE